MRIAVIFVIFVSISVFSFAQKRSCNADFVYEIDSANHFKYNFLDSSHATGFVNYSWNFGDSTYSKLKNPTHMYGFKGVYKVRLIIKNGSCSDTVIKTISVATTGALCNADFFVKRNENDIYKFNFYDNTLGNPKKWLWKFGDGDSSTLQNPIHKYKKSGLYNISLTMFDSISFCASKYSAVLKVVSKCKTRFEDTFVCYSKTFKFKNKSIYTNADTKYFWNFGDGNISQLENPTHNYSKSGNYMVKLKISDTNTLCLDSNFYHLNVNNSLPCYYNLGGSLKVDHDTILNGEVYLLKYTQNNKKYKIIDTCRLNNKKTFIFKHQIAGFYSIFAKINDKSSYYENTVPTYLGKTSFWQKADNILLNKDIYNADVSMVKTKKFGKNSGKISGKTARIDINDSLDFVNGIEILLLDKNDEPLKCQFTNGDGDFCFKNLPFGEYKIHTEILNLNTYPYHLTLNVKNSVILNLILQLNLVGVNFDYSEIVKISSPYPIPSKSNLYIDFETKQKGIWTCKLVDTKGKILLTKNILSEHLIQNMFINLKSFDKGIYFIVILYENKIVTTFKILKV